MIERMDMQTKDLSQEKIRMLGELFPDCITESKEGDKVVLDFRTSSKPANALFFL